MRDFKDRVAVVTGAASGIGAALAEAFGARGMRVVLADIEASALARVEDSLRASGVECLSVPTDVGDADAVQALGRAAVERFGGVHLVCNNAGVAVGGNSWQQSVQDYEWVFRVNFYGVVNGLRTFVPLLMEQEEETHIVNTSSMAGLTNSPGFAAYYASKHAVMSLSETLHLELESACPRIGVSVLCPEIVRTRIGDSGRNRPAPLEATGPSTPEREVYEGSLLSFTAESPMLPKDIAQRVLHGIEERQFFILPPAEDPFIQTMEARLEAIHTRQNPGMAISLEPPVLEK